MLRTAGPAGSLFVAIHLEPVAKVYLRGIGTSPSGQATSESLTAAAQITLRAVTLVVDWGLPIIHDPCQVRFPTDPPSMDDPSHPYADSASADVCNVAVLDQLASSNRFTFNAFILRTERANDLALANRDLRDGDDL